MTALVKVQMVEEQILTYDVRKGAIMKVLFKVLTSPLLFSPLFSLHLLNPQSSISRLDQSVAAPLIG